MSKLTSRQRAELMVKLQNKIKSIISKSDYGDNDIRKAVFSNCRSFIMSSILTLKVLSIREENRLDDKLYVGLFGLTKDASTSFFNSYGKFTRLSLVTMFQFQVENLLKNILFALTSKKPPKGFYKISKELFNLISIEDKSYKQDALYVPAMIRNTFHSNGIHTEKTKSLEIKGEKFEFIQNNNISCASWYHIYTSFDKSIDIMNEIISNTKIASLEHVSDQYFPPTD